MKGKGIEKIFCSTLLRARESAEIINTLLRVPIEYTEALKERSYGVLGGLTKQEAINRFPSVVELHKDSNNTDPDGESKIDFTSRVINEFNRISENNYSTIIILAHGGTIKTILQELQQPLPNRIDDGGIIEVQI